MQHFRVSLLFIFKMLLLSSLLSTHTPQTTLPKCCAVRGYALYLFLFKRNFPQIKKKNSMKTKTMASEKKATFVGGSVLFGLIQISCLAMFGLSAFKISLLRFWNIVKVLLLVSSQNGAFKTTTKTNVITIAVWWGFYLERTAFSVNSSRNYILVKHPHVQPELQQWHCWGKKKTTTLC